MPTLHIRNLRALREVHWNPVGVCAVVGSNGAGKTTLALALKLIRAAVDRGLPRAVTTVLGGSHGLRHWDADDDEPIELGLDVDDLSWRVQLVIRGATVDHLAREELRCGDEVVFVKDELGNFVYGTERRDSDERLGLRAIADGPEPHPAVVRMLASIRGITVFHDPDLWTLRQQGSRAADDRRLASRGGNVFTMLRRWHESRDDRHRYQFVLDGLRAAFPGLCEDLDFEPASQTVTVRVFAPAASGGEPHPSPIGNEAHGVLALLVVLADIAAADRGGLVAIDEPENGLHPYAIRELMRRARARARTQDLTILLTTHSSVVLDELSAEPTQVFVLRRDEPSLVRLDQHRNPRWLANFKLGELYADGELGSNDDVA